jgi:hypothetical protein
LTRARRISKQLANHDDPPDRDERGADGWQDLAVANPTFLLVIWGV